MYLDIFMIGLSRFSKNTNLFQSVKMHKIFDFIDFNNWILFSNILNFHSCATGFNMDQLCNRFECSKTLYSGVNEICIRKHINIIKFIFDNQIISAIKNGFFEIVPGGNEIVD